jgi:hypothetical protein
MKDFLLNNEVVGIWKEASTFTEYLIAFWLTSMIVLAVSGFTFLIIKWIMNPSMWDAVQFGIYDYLG